MVHAKNEKDVTTGLRLSLINAFFDGAAMLSLLINFNGFFLQNKRKMFRDVLTFPCCTSQFEGYFWYQNQV